VTPIRDVKRKLSDLVNEGAEEGAGSEKPMSAGTLVDTSSDEGDEKE